MTGSWVPVPAGSDFPLENLPYGVFAPPDAPPRTGVAIGDHVLDLSAVAGAGLFEGLAADVFAQPTLNAFLREGREAWTLVRRTIAGLLSAGNEGEVPAAALVPAPTVSLLLPVAVADYVDFYSSLEHATNLGRMFRPDGDPLLPNWRWLPVAYHGRASTVVVSGTPVRRPSGQVQAGDEPPRWAPTARLDFELEVGFITGPGNELGRRIATWEAAEHIFGLVLVNDWSARDIQRWEYQPLGPFLGKSFATSISPWIVSLDALAPYRVPAPAQDPEPPEYLHTLADWGLDLELEVALAPEGGEETVISRTNFRHMYWTMAQQLAHVTVNGTTVRPGDLYASGTVSGAEEGTFGSLLELSHGGTQPVALRAGERRSFLEDGDTVTMRAWAGGDDEPRIGFGEVRGMVLPAQ